MGFGDAISTCFAKYATFTGRAMRSEYWFWVLFGILGQIVSAVIDALVLRSGIGILGLAFSLATILPSLAVSVRRLHDIDRSGWWVLIALIPLVGTIILIVWACTRGTPGNNHYGPAPLPPR